MPPDGDDGATFAGLGLQVAERKGYLGPALLGLGLIIGSSYKALADWEASYLWGTLAGLGMMTLNPLNEGGDTELTWLTGASPGGDGRGARGWSARWALPIELSDGFGVNLGLAWARWEVEMEGLSGASYTTSYRAYALPVGLYARFGSHYQYGLRVDWDLNLASDEADLVEGRFRWGNSPLRLLAEISPTDFLYLRAGANASSASVDSVGLHVDLGLRLSDD